jgi:hypothetical protein
MGALCGDKSGPSARILAPMSEKKPKFGGKSEISFFGARPVQRQKKLSLFSVLKGKMTNFISFYYKYTFHVY